MGGYMPETAAGRARAARYPPLSSLVVSTIAAFSAVIVVAILRSVKSRFPLNCRIHFDSSLRDVVVDDGGGFMARWCVGVRRRGVANADAGGAQPGADAVAPVPARQGPAAGARRVPVRLLPLLPAAAGAAGDRRQRVGRRRRRRRPAPMPRLLRRHPARPRAVAPRRGRDAGAAQRRAAARVHARHHHRRRAAAARGPLLRLRAEPRAVHRVEPAAAHAAVPRPRARRRPHVRLHGPAGHQPDRARRRRPHRTTTASPVPVLHHPRPLRHPLPGLVLLGLAGDEHRAMEPGVQEHQAGSQGEAMAGQGADGVLEGEPGRGGAAAGRAAGLQRHQPVASRDHAPELEGGSQGRVPELQALHPVHSPVQDLRGGVRVVGEPQVHPVVRIDGADHRPAVRGLLQPGSRAEGELLAGEPRRRHVRVDQGRGGVGQRAPGGGGAGGAARAAADAGAGHGRRLRLHAPPAARVRAAHGLPAGADPDGAGGVRGVAALPRRRAAAEVLGGLRGGAGDRGPVRHASRRQRRRRSGRRRIEVKKQNIRSSRFWSKHSTEK